MSATLPTALASRTFFARPQQTNAAPRANFFRLHRQLVMGNEKRYFYDYYMICCGPMQLQERVLRPELVVPSFAPDGSLIDPQTVAESTQGTAQ